MGLVVTPMFVHGRRHLSSRQGLALPAMLHLMNVLWEALKLNMCQEEARGWMGVNLLFSAPPWGQSFQ